MDPRTATSWSVSYKLFTATRARNNYKIIDNFISNKELFNIQSLFLDQHITSPIPWYYNAGTTDDYELTKVQYDVENYYFSHLSLPQDIQIFTSGSKDIGE